MGLVSAWTGRTACALQEALRLSHELFAERLGIAPRTVAAWHQKPDLRPNSEMQHRLDTALERAAPQAKSRFAALVAAFTDFAPELPAADTSTITVPDVLAEGAITTDPAAEQAWQQLARQSGEVVELSMRVSLDIQEDGWARITYHRELANLGNRPMSRLSCELWFEHTQGPLRITPIEDGSRRVAIHRTHDTPSSAQFSCLISPPIRPGESAIVGYACEGCQFVEDHYWRQSVRRHTRRFNMQLRHRGVAALMDYTATEELRDGAEISATDDLEWDEHEGAVDLRLTRHYLRPGQAVTLRWEVSHAPS